MARGIGCRAARVARRLGAWPKGWGFDRSTPSGHNGFVRRLLLLAIGLSALLWTMAARQGPNPLRDIVQMSGVESRAGADDSQGPLDPDQLWRVQHGAVAPTTESMWKSAPVHAALAATRSLRTFETALAVSSPDPPVSLASHYLRHTPLLI